MRLKVHYILTPKTNKMDMKKLNVFILLLLLSSITPLVSAQIKPDLSAYNSIFQTIDNIFIIIFVAYIAISLFRLFRLYRKEGFVFVGFFSKIKPVIAIAVSLAGVVIFIIAMFMPLYKVNVDANAGPINTNGMKEILSIDGLNGVTVDKTLLGGFELPKQSSLSLVLLIIVLSSAFGVLGAKSLRSFGFGNIKGGTCIVALVIITIVLANMLPGLINNMAANFKLGEQNPLANLFLKDLTNSLSNQPLKGEYLRNITMPVKAHIKLQWGFESGFWMFLVAGVVKLAGGVLAVIFSFGGKKKEEKEKKQKGEKQKEEKKKKEEPEEEEQNEEKKKQDSEKEESEPKSNTEEEKEKKKVRKKGKKK